MTTVVGGVYKTQDMVEAAILSLHGLTPSFESLDSRYALFVFTLRESDDPEYFEGILDDIRCSRFMVEPKRFAREMKVVREALYDFLKVDRDHLRLHRRSSR